MFLIREGNTPYIFKFIADVLSSREPGGVAYVEGVMNGVIADEMAEKVERYEFV